MAQQEKYVAYVGTYTHGTSIGIHVYDINIEEGIMTEREVIPVNNASHMAKSYSGKYLYSIADDWNRSTKSVSTACAVAIFPPIKMENFFM